MKGIMRTNTNRTSTTIFAAICSLALTLSVSAETVRYNSQPIGSSTKIEGTSTVHDWHMDSKLISGYIEADAKFPEAALTDASAAKPVVNVSIPVTTFKSNSRKMDEVMQEAMKAKQHPKIEYKLIELKPKSDTASSGSAQFDAVGVLTVAGTARTNSMPVTITKTEDKLKVSGSISLKMTNYGVEPPAPTIALGLLKTGDEVKITFEWLTAKAK